MPSIEALDKLKETIKDYVCNFEKDYTPMDFEKWYYKSKFENIQKDLEVLDLLKRYIKKDLKWFMYNSGDSWYWCIDKIQSMEITDEEFEKLKEWLNDKH